MGRKKGGCHLERTSVIQLLCNILTQKPAFSRKNRISWHTLGTHDPTCVLVSLSYVSPQSFMRLDSPLLISEVCSVSNPSL